MKKVLLLIVLFFCFSDFSFSQDSFVIGNKKQSDKIRFKLINNLIVIPINVNGAKLSFLLDTGVSKPIVFNDSDTLKVKNGETILLRGLGGGEPIKALKSRNNIFKIGDAVKQSQELFSIYDSNLNFSPRLGVPIHGIIGFDLFKDFVVEINYSSKYIRLTASNTFEYKKCRKCEVLDLELHKNKPYINADVNIKNKKVRAKLLVDTGGTDAIWLFKNDSLGISLDNKFFEDFLGYGLNGAIYGKRSKLDAFFLNTFELKHVNVAFPNEDQSLLLAKKVKGRNGSIAGNILKRFNIIVDYKNEKITFKKNTNFKEKFSYNKSGIELAHEGVRFVKERNFSSTNTNAKSLYKANETNKKDGIKYKLALKPAYKITELRKKSPAYNAGLKVGDVLLSINNKQAHIYSLQQITSMFYGKEGKRIKLKVNRGGAVFLSSFVLENVFK